MPGDVWAYISDMLAELADLARGLGDPRLETAIRVLALETAAAERRSRGGRPRAAG